MLTGAQFRGVVVSAALAALGGTSGNVHGWSLQLIPNNGASVSKSDDPAAGTGQETQENDGGTSSDASIDSPSSSGARAATSIETAPDPPESSARAAESVADSIERRIPATRDAEALGMPPRPVSAEESEHEDSGSRGLASLLRPESGEFVRVIGALSAVIGLIFLLRIMVKRASGSVRSASRPSGVIETLAKYPVARGQQLVILKLARRIILVHQAGSTMTTISEITDRDEVAALLSRFEAASHDGAGARFQGVLKGFADQHRRIKRRSSHSAGRETFGVGGNDTVETIDLTRSQSRGLLALFGKGKGGV